MTSHRLLDSAELEECLGVVRRPRARVRRTPAESPRLPICLAEGFCARRRVSAPESDESRHRLQQGWIEADLLLAQLQASFSFLPSELELPAMHCNPRARNVVLVLLDPVLKADVASAGGVGRRAVPPPCPEFEPGELPDHPCVEELVAILPLSVLLFQRHACRVDAAGVDEHPPDEGVRLPQQARVAAGGRNIECARSVCRRVRVAHHAAEPTQLRERLEAKAIVADAVGEHECGTGALEGAREALPEAFRRGEADVDERLERRVRRRLA